MCHKNNMPKVTSNSIEKGTEHQLLVDDCVPEQGRAKGRKKQFHFIDFKSCLWNGGANFRDGMWHRLKIGWHFFFRSSPSPSVGRSLVFSVFFMKKIFLAIFSVKMWSPGFIMVQNLMNQKMSLLIRCSRTERTALLGWRSGYFLRLCVAVRRQW